ncbi:MAG: DUF2889 domain-containing protein [Sphingorhabdus sp.]
MPMFCRAVRLRSEPGCTLIELEDNFHKMQLSLIHDGQIITSVTAEMHRVPWLTCNEAPELLQQLEASELNALAQGLPRAQRYLHCTHLLDLAMLAAAQGADPVIAQRLYQVNIDVPQPYVFRHVAMTRDGETQLDWRISENAKIESDDAFNGLGQKDLLAAAKALPGWKGREILIVRRAMHVGYGLGLPLDDYKMASEIGVSPTCHTYNPANVTRALRSENSLRDFNGKTDVPLKKASVHY